MRLDTDGLDDIEMTSGARAERQERRAGRKSKRTGKKGTRMEKRTTRKAARTTKKAERILKRKARKDARKLKPRRNKRGEMVYTDAVPVVTEVPTGTGVDLVKTDPNTGEVTKLDLTDVKTIPSTMPNVPPIKVDKKDVPDGKEKDLNVTPDGNVTVDYTEPETEEVDFGDGTTGRVPSDFAEDPGMSKKLKTGLIIGGVVLVVGVIATILIVRAKKKKGK